VNIARLVGIQAPPTVADDVEKNRYTFSLTEIVLKACATIAGNPDTNCRSQAGI